MQINIDLKNIGYGWPKNIPIGCMAKRINPEGYYFVCQIGNEYLCMGCNIMYVITRELLLDNYIFIREIDGLNISEG